jgi:hypothetical protein
MSIGLFSPRSSQPLECSPPNNSTDGRKPSASCNINQTEVLADYSAQYLLYGPAASQPLFCAALTGVTVADSCSFLDMLRRQFIPIWSKLRLPSKGIG